MTTQRKTGTIRAVTAKTPAKPLTPYQRERAAEAIMLGVETGFDKYCKAARGIRRDELKTGEQVEWDHLERCMEAARIAAVRLRWLLDRGFVPDD